MKATLFPAFCILALAAALPCPAQTPPIPPRPEQLAFPPLVYEPPAPEKFRVALKSGPIAYVVPDRELPLVNLVVYAHTGSYLEPAGKEGLADLTGYLLARGGTKSRTAEALEMYRDVVASHPDGSWAADAKERVRSLSAKTPAAS